MFVSVLAQLHKRVSRLESQLDAPASPFASVTAREQGASGRKYEHERTVLENKEIVKREQLQIETFINTKGGARVEQLKGYYQLIVKYFDWDQEKYTRAFQLNVLQPPAPYRNRLKVHVKYRVSGENALYPYVYVDYFDFSTTTWTLRH